MDFITEQPLATLNSTAGKPVLTFERQFDHPRELVWRAITDPVELSQWFPASVRTEPFVGAPMRFSFDGQLDLGDRYADGEVLELEPPAVYAFRWVDAYYRFELTPTESGCRLLFVVTLSGVRTTGDLPSITRQAPGWDGCLEILAARLDGREAVPMDGPHFLDRAERYVEEYGLADGVVEPGSVVEGEGDGYVVRFERDLVQSPAIVWETLAGVDERPEGPVVGGAPPLVSTHGYLCEGDLTEVEPTRVIEYSWRHDDAPAGHVRFELQAQEPIGTRLVLTQSVPASLGDLLPAALAAWHTHLELFFAALYDDVRCPWPTHRTEHLTKLYADRLTEIER